jgi:hypothetical protein
MIELSELITYIREILTPIAMISGLGLVSLLTQTRYGRVVDSMRHLNVEKLCLLKSLLPKSDNEIEKKANIMRINNIDVQLQLFIKRGAYLKRALISLLIGIFLFIISAILILGRELIPLELMVMVTGISFVAGLFLLAVGAMLMITDLNLSQKAVIIDSEGIHKINECIMESL